LALLFLAALVLTLALAPGQGMAAPGRQNSPLTPAAIVVSPLGSPLSTPTPTATSPLPPTVEPPAGLQAWPTPTATPYASPVQAAIDFLAGDSDLGVTEAELLVQLSVDDPATGDELTVVRLRDSATGEAYWLRSDRAGEVALLPDYSEQALALVAAAKKVDAADVSVFQSLYAPFPFTRQILWVGQVFNPKNGDQIPVAIDLAGQEVDLEGVKEAEAAAIGDYCGTMDVSLCLEILNAAPGAASNAVLTLVEGGDPDPIIAFLDEQGVTYRADEGVFYFRMENDALRDLAHLDNIDTLQKDFPDEVRPLDANLVIGLIEQSGALSLTLESHKEYPLLTYRVEATLERVEITQTQSVTLAAQIAGIFTPASGPSSPAPALGRLALGELSGRYNLSLSYTDPERGLDLLDRYLLIVSNGRAVIRPVETTFSWAKYPTWLRLPRNAIWFVVQARMADGAGKPIDSDADKFAAKADAFYADVAKLRARELSLAEGVYTNDLFVPPWSSWQIPDGEFVRVPVDAGQDFVFKWPQIRYFTFSGRLSSIEKVMARHCVDEVAIVGYTAGGDILDVCQP